MEATDKPEWSEEEYVEIYRTAEMLGYSLKDCMTIIRNSNNFRFHSERDRKFYHLKLHSMNISLGTWNRIKRK